MRFPMAAGDEALGEDAAGEPHADELVSVGDDLLFKGGDAERSPTLGEPKRVTKLDSTLRGKRKM